MGATLGTLLAFTMSVIALSVPEMVALRNALSLKLIAMFVGVVAIGILAVGLLPKAEDIGKWLAREEWYPT